MVLMCWSSRSAARRALAIGLVCLDSAVMVTTVVTRFIARLALDWLDVHSIIIIGGAPYRIQKAPRQRARHLEQRLMGSNPDSANISPADMAMTAQKRQYPSGIGVLPAADIEPKPGAIFKTGAWPTWLLRGFADNQILWLGQTSAVGMDERGRDVLGAPLGQQTRRERTILFADFSRGEEGRKQPLIIRLTNFIGGWRLGPFGSDACASQHRFNALAARIGHDQHRRTLPAGPTGAA